MPRNDRKITLRRTIQQTKQALAIVERNEDIRCATDDLEQAELLIRRCLEQTRPLT